VADLTLGEKQRLFTIHVARLILWANDHGYELTFGEAQRSMTQAVANSRSGAGIKNSLHLVRLAIDLNLFKDGIYQPDSAAHAPLGEFWKSLHPDNRWGGDFSKPDGNHYSMTHEGVS
jgi:hypothetical protein